MPILRSFTQVRSQLGLRPLCATESASEAARRTGGPAVLAQALRSSGDSARASRTRGPGQASVEGSEAWLMPVVVDVASAGGFAHTCLVGADVLWLMFHQQPVVARASGHPHVGNRSGHSSAAHGSSSTGEARARDAGGIRAVSGRQVPATRAVVTSCPRPHRLGQRQGGLSRIHGRAGHRSPTLPGRTAPAERRGGMAAHQGRAGRRGDRPGP